MRVELGAGGKGNVMFRTMGHTSSADACGRNNHDSLATAI